MEHKSPYKASRERSPNPYTLNYQIYEIFYMFSFCRGNYDIIVDFILINFKFIDANTPIV